MKNKNIVIIFVILALVITAISIRTSINKRKVYSEYNNRIVKVHRIIDDTILRISKAYNSDDISNKNQIDITNSIKNIYSKMSTITSTMSSPVDNYTEKIWELLNNKLYPEIVALYDITLDKYDEKTLDSKYTKDILNLLENLNNYFVVEGNENNVKLGDEQINKLVNSINELKVFLSKFR